MRKLILLIFLVISSISFSQEKRYEFELRNILSKWMDVTEKRINYYSKYALASELLIKQYTHYAGNQD